MVGTRLIAAPLLCLVTIGVQAQEQCPPGGCGEFGTCLPCDENDACVGERCKCDHTHVGDDCSMAVDYCPDTVDPKNSVSSCWNGGTCRLYLVRYHSPDYWMGAEDVLVERYRCDCSTAYGEAAAYAGHQCEYPHSTSCDLDHPDGSNYTFCVNGGTCAAMVHFGQPHPGCLNCPDDLEGAHCQFAKDTTPLEVVEINMDETPTLLNDDSDDDTDDDNSFSGVGWFLLVALLGGLVFAVGFIGLSYSRRRYQGHGSTNAITSESAKNVQQDEEYTDDNYGGDIQLQQVAIDGSVGGSAAATDADVTAESDLDLQEVQIQSDGDGDEQDVKEIL